ncbi:MAG TPA: PQQ-binding-like beta-propeller repeat protein, partial [Candidatus Acidoferrales bacterium]|nr:PQQ-binding-like beta-propeller repeat protein [Candidatus Acidoferrales bacterium]
RGDQAVEARELPSGKLRWTTRLNGRVSSNIAVADERVYVKTGADSLAQLSLTGVVDRYLKIAKPGAPAATSD